jgi:DNA-binding response OmpR family regulator
MTTILVIEDQAPIRENLIELLQEEGFNAVGFERGFTGMMWALKHVPDLIICDIMMPDMDGYTVLSELNHYPATATVGFIFLSAKADKSSVREGMDLGADVYLTKPYRRTELLKAISVCLEKQAAIRQALKLKSISD